MIYKKKFFNLLFSSVLQIAIFTLPVECRASDETMVDHQKIEDLMVRYMDVLDAGDYDAYASLFSSTAVLKYGDNQLHGRDEILRVVRTELEALRNPKASDGRALPSLGMHHLLLNPTIIIQGGRAHATATWLFIKISSDGRAELWGAGRYVDTLVKSGSGWKFQSRIVVDTVADTISKNSLIHK